MAKEIKSVTKQNAETFQGRFTEVMRTLADAQWQIQNLKEDIGTAVQKLKIVPPEIQSTIDWLEEADTDLEGLVWAKADLSALDAEPKKVKRIG